MRKVAPEVRRDTKRDPSDSNQRRETLKVESGVPQIPTNWFYLLSFLRDRALKPPPDYYDQPAHPWPPRDTNIS